MGYYIRILGTSNPNIHVDDLINGLTREGLTAKLQIDENESVENWTNILVSDSDGKDLAQVERNPVINGELGEEELEEFKETIKECKPASAVKWLNKYFDNIKVIYAFQLLNASFDDKNFPIITSIKSTIYTKTGGIFQADNEGFSNDHGYHILWQFADNVSGEWDMAVKNFFGWTNFQMNLGDLKQREEFWQGKLPKGAVKYK
jgi:hypothetical protein